MPETMPIHHSNPESNNNDDLLDEIRNAVTMNEAVWSLDADRQALASQYIELNQKIDSLPKFEKNEIRKMIMEFLSSLASEQGEEFRNRGVVQYFSGSSKPQSYWEACKFTTADQKFEDYLNNKIRPVVEEMVSDQNNQGVR